MTSPIDPVRRAARLRRLRRRADGSEDTGAPQDEAQLPAVVEPPPPPAPAAASAGGPSGFTAHVMAQGEQRRGLKGGAETLQPARNAYNRTEYSGRADRRAPAGGVTRTKI